MKRKWNGSDLARHMGVSRAEANRFLNGTRRGGKKLIAGLIQAFPEESLEALFFLPYALPNDNASAGGDSCRSPTLSPSEYSSAVEMKPVRHPNERRLACSMNEEAGMIQIINGRNITVLIIPPGSIEVRHTTKKYAAG